MKKKNKIQRLQEKYNIPDEELIEIGLKVEETLTNTVRITEDIKNDYSLICAKKNVKVSKDIRDCIQFLLEKDEKTQKKIADKIKIFEENKGRGGDHVNVTYILTIKQDRKVKKFCGKYGIRYYSSLPQYFIYATVERGGGNLSDILC